MKDATDRNRTSPFAFTGNKFEFRMVGSRDSISECNVVLNTIAAQAFKEACDRLEAAPDFDLAVHDLIKEYATEHQRIVFNGNGYAPEWEEEAKRRGLPILPSMVDAIPALTTEKAVELLKLSMYLLRQNWNPVWRSSMRFMQKPLTLRQRQCWILLPSRSFRQ